MMSRMNSLISEPHRKLKIIAISLAVILLIVLSYFLILPPGSKNQSYIFEVNRGDTLKSISGRLEERGLIRSRIFFMFYVLAMGQDRNLKAGDYIVYRSMNSIQVANKIVGGHSKPDDVVVLIPEGFNIWEIDQRLAYYGLAEEGQFAKKFYKQEGKFFPDTYRFSPRLLISRLEPKDRDAALQEIGNKMIQNFNNKVLYINPKILVFASLLEKEARKEEDMKLVAGVIQNRLDRGMLLQVDAAVGYGWCLKKFAQQNYSKDCDTTQAPIASEIRAQSPFNTYKVKGLPPSPIANPGMQSLEAAQNPTKSDYLYYLSTRDGSRMIFSKTGAEHEANRRKYLGL
jgi:UPF0755 protein